MSVALLLLSVALVGDGWTYAGYERAGVVNTTPGRLANCACDRCRADEVGPPAPDEVTALQGENTGLRRKGELLQRANADLSATVATLDGRARDAKAEADKLRAKVAELERRLAAAPAPAPCPAPRAVARRKAEIRWWVKGVPDGHESAAVEQALADAARRWSVADVEIRKAASEADANLHVWAEPMEPPYVAWTSVGDPNLLKSGTHAPMAMRLSKVLRPDRRHLLNVVVHEMGHALGIGKHGPPGNVMEPAAEHAELSEADVNEIVALYGAAKP